MTWLDTPFQPKASHDAEWKGVNFLPEIHSARKEWFQYWPHTGNVPNWDAVGVLKNNGAHEWLLVEAKANLQELRSACNATQKGGLAQIVQALSAVKSELGVKKEKDWLKGYYQYCNRLAVLQFLQAQKIPSRLLFVYFTGDRSGPGRTCPRDAAGWKKALQVLDKHVGLSTDHSLADRVHRLFLPVVPSRP